jgi:hypothetical protein
MGPQRRHAAWHDCNPTGRKKEMTRTLKALGLCLFAACSFAAVAASSASAVTDTFTCSVEPCVVTGEQTGAVHTFGIKNNPFTVECEHATFVGTSKTKATTEITVHPTYTECNNTVDVAAGCNLILTGVTDEHLNTAGTKTETHATVKVECGANEFIKVTGPGCTIKMTGAAGGVNQNLLGVTYDNGTDASGHKDVTVTVTVDSIHFTSEGSLCAFGGIPSTGTNAFLTQTVTARGYGDPDTGTNQANIELS